MARLDSKVIFVTTSPRTPAKMVPEIALLSEHFTGQVWDKTTQVAFMECLRDENFFNGKGANDPAFSARDRINRAPKALGFVTLSPTIKLTPAGQALISSKRKEDIFLRQLLKFQVPSPFHTPNPESANFWVKPYLELFRLIRHFGSLKFDEVQLFGLQLVDYRDFDKIVQKIEKFRTDKAIHSGSYKNFFGQYMDQELRKIYAYEISRGSTKTRESSDASIRKFLKTKAQNMRDYTDACFRYLRATGLVNISHVGKSISIVSEKTEEVDFFLSTVDRNPCFIEDEYHYMEYLGSRSTPQLLFDDREYLIRKIHQEFPVFQIPVSASTERLKELFDDLIIERREGIIHDQITRIKDYREYEDIQNTFDNIVNGSIYDPSLMLEWNVWRAMTMLDGGNIVANTKFDDFGKPMSTAQGNVADIVCDYGKFGVIVEVTMATGQRQYEMEGEPVSRHLAKIKKAINKPAYCLFIAPSINEACIAHFFALHKMNISYYGGTSTIIPLSLEVFRKMVQDSYKAEYVPLPDQVKYLFESSENIVKHCDSETDWYKQINNVALNWLQPTV